MLEVTEYCRHALGRIKDEKNLKKSKFQANITLSKNKLK